MITGGAAGWNHNVHYHDLILRTIPAGFEHALEVGCGEGELARRLASQGEGHITAIDVDRETLGRARGANGGDQRIEYLEGDVMSHPFGEASFDAITAVATLHHLPLRPALRRFSRLLKPGGVLAVVGLYRAQTVTDYAFWASAAPVSRAIRLVRGFSEVAAPLADPKEPLDEIRAAACDLLPGARLRRLLLFRYLLLWRK